MKEGISLQTEMPDGANIQYGTNRLSLGCILTIGECVNSMAEIFPELKNCNWTYDERCNTLYLSVVSIKTSYGEWLHSRREMPDIDIDLGVSHANINNNADATWLLRKD